MSARPLHDKLITLLTEGVAERVFTRASVAVVRSGQLYERAATHRTSDIFDVASVTKVLTAVLAVRHLQLDFRISHLDEQPTYGDLLSHRSGLPAWRPLFAIAARELGVTLPELIAKPSLRDQARAIYHEVIASTPATAPQPTYSDLNFLALGFALELQTGLPLPLIARRDLFDPLELISMHWGDQHEAAVPTGRGRPRAGNPAVEAEVIGAVDPDAEDRAVDDDNAAAIGGAAGHAGLWSDAIDLALFGDLIRQAAEGTSDLLLPREQAGLLFTRIAGSRTYGLDTPSGDMPAIGTRLGRGPKGAAGHLGFTGCSLWMDRDAELTVAFLSDAVAVERPNPRIRAFRPRLHDLVAESLGIG